MEEKQNIEETLKRAAEMIRKLDIEIARKKGILQGMEYASGNKNGLIGGFKGWRIGGKTYDPEGNEIEEKHEEDCFCCRKSLLKAPHST